MGATRSVVTAKVKEHLRILTTAGPEKYYNTRSICRCSPTRNRQYTENFVDVHPTDAERYGIKDGLYVQFRSRRGEITVKAQVTKEINETRSGRRRTSQPRPRTVSRTTYSMKGRKFRSKGPLPVTLRFPLNCLGLLPTTETPSPFKISNTYATDN